MKFKLNFAAVFLISLISITQSQKPANISIDCTLSNVNYIYFGFQSSCTAKGPLNIVNINTTVTSINGQSNPNTNTKVFYVLAKVAKYIPYGLEVFFPNLIGFRLESTQLKIVTKENLKPFPNLLMFASVGNQIEFLEKDLFTYNTKIEYVSFRANKISYIDPTVFSVIGGTLQQLYMDGQALLCGLGNTITPGGVRNALSKLGNSVCADITNAPPLYVILQQVKEQLNSGGGDLQKCQADLATAQADLTSCNGNLTEAKTNLTTANDALAKANTDLDTLNTTLISTNGELTTCNTTAEKCATDLAACQAGTCATDLTTCQSDLSAANEAKTACETDKTACNTDLGTCQADSATCTADLGTCNDDKTFCEGCRTTPTGPGC